MISHNNQKSKLNRKSERSALLIPHTRFDKMNLRSANIKYTVIMMMAALVICWGPMITWNILRYFEGDFKFKNESH